MIYKCLNEIENKKELIECVNLAFSDYYVPIHFNEKSFEMFLSSSGVDSSLSFVVYEDNKPVGFVFNSSGIFNGDYVVFDAGTGVVPNYRGKGVFTSLFNFVEFQLKQKHITKYYLEVLQNNENAIRLYTKLGFKINRSFLVMMSNQQIQVKGDQIDELLLKEFDYHSIKHLNIVSPSFENNINNILNSISLYSILYRMDKKTSEIVSFIIYCHLDGRVIQMGYDNISNLKPLILNLIGKYPKILIKNIDESYQEAVDLLHQIGFVDLAKQYEMVKILN